jgi:hypothetical protein
MSDEDQGAAKRHKAHEAQMIPGLKDGKVYGFPNSIITKLRYVDSVNLTGTTGARGLNVFAANGIFDPDVTGTGHQPLYRDSYAGIYDQYCVLGSKIKVSFSVNTADVPVIVGIQGDDDSAISTTVTTLMEQNNSYYEIMSSRAGGGTAVVNCYFEPLEHFGVAVKDDGSSSTAVGANASELWCYGVWAAAADAVSTVSVNAIVEIEYIVKFSELQSPLQN